MFATMSVPTSDQCIIRFMTCSLTNRSSFQTKQASE